MSAVSASVTRRPLTKTGSLPEAPHHAADLGAAAVDDHRAQADVLQQDDVLQHLGAPRLLHHRRAAILDDDGLAAELTQVRQGLDQHARPLSQGFKIRLCLRLLAHGCLGGRPAGRP